MRPLLLATLLFAACHQAAAPPNCSDHLKNGEETDVDCGGGDCPNCGTGKTCLGAGDCQSRVCGLDGRCAAPSCSDKLRNGSETDLDCGGPDCPRCADGQNCYGNNDCQSTICAGGSCTKPSCDDGFKNQGEQGIDCGGPCHPCDGG